MGLWQPHTLPSIPPRCCTLHFPDSLARDFCLDLAKVSPWQVERRSHPGPRMSTGGASIAFQQQPGKPPSEVPAYLCGLQSSCFCKWPPQSCLVLCTPPSSFYSTIIIMIVLAKWPQSTSSPFDVTIKLLPSKGGVYFPILSLGWLDDWLSPTNGNKAMLYRFQF